MASSYKDIIRWEFDWASANRYRSQDPKEDGTLRRDRTIRRRTPTPEKDDDGVAKPWSEENSLSDAINEAPAMGFWRPYTGYTLEGKKGGPIPGWKVEEDPEANSYRRKRNEYLGEWKRTDSRTFEVQMIDHAGSKRGGSGPEQEYVQRLTHPLPDDPIWMKEPIEAKNGVITASTNPIDVNVRMRITDIAEINTVNCTATVQIDLGIFWTDLRLIGYDHQVLPDKLWSPRLEMLRAEVKETQLAFMRLETGRYFNAGDYLCTAAKRFNTHHRNGKLRYWPTPGTATDPRPWPESGRMMKSVRYDAVVDNPMSSLDDFPFDLDKIELNWITTSSWETRDLSMKGVRVTQTAWNLRYIQKYGNLGQITKLQRLYQAKYQAETIKAALEKDFEGTSFSLSTKGVKADDEEAPRDGEIADDDLDKILEGAYFNKKNFPKTKFDIHGHYQGIDIGENSDIPPIDGNHPSLGVLFDQLRDYRKPGQVVLKNGTCAQEGDGTYEEADVLLAGDPEGGPKYWIYQDGTREKAIDPETRRTAGGPQYKNNGWRAEKAAAKIKREKIGRIARMLAVLEAQREKAKNNSSDEVDDDDANDEDATDSSAWAQGRIISRACDGDLDEWECLGASYQITRHPQLTHSPQRQELNLFIHMKRKSGYYIFKVLIPLYLIQFLMYTTMYMDTDDISGRLGFTVTGFLAAFAMLYIVGQDLPKLDQTTSIDRIINLTTVTIVGLAVGSCRVYHTHKKMCNVPEPKFDLVNLSGIGEAHAFYQQLWSSADDPCEDAIFEDKFITGMLVLVNVIGSIYFFAGPLWHQRTYTHQIKKEEQNYSGKTKKLTNEEKMRRAYRKKNGGRGFPEMEAEGEEDEMTKADEDVEVEEDLRLTDKTIATMSTYARRKHLRKLKDSVNKAKNMRLMLQFFIDEEDKPDAFVDLPTVNKFCDYVPWHSVETYQDYLRRRLNGKRVSGGVTSEVRFLQDNIDEWDRLAQALNGVKKTSAKEREERKQTKSQVTKNPIADVK